MNHIPKSSNQEVVFEINDMNNENTNSNFSNLFILDEIFLEVCGSNNAIQAFEREIKILFSKLETKFWE